jgi:DNA-binding beta-propeller fold protein YncE
MVRLTQCLPFFAAFFVICTASVVSAHGDDVEFDWAVSFGNEFPSYGKGVAVDAEGNIYTTGRFIDTVDFDPGPETFELSSIGHTADIFVQKLSPGGDLVWAKSMGSIVDEFGLGYDHATAIAVDHSGNVYTTGLFLGTMDFDPGPGVANLTGGGIFVSKLDKHGNYVWAKSMANRGIESGMGIAVDAAGNVYTTGVFLSAEDFDPGPNVFVLESNGRFDAFVTKFDSLGNLLWAKSVGGEDRDYSNDVAVDATGNVYLTGSFRDVVDFNPGVETYYLSSDGSWDSFVLKLDANGAFVWATRTGGAHYDDAFGVAIDPSGNVLTTGTYHGTVDFDPGPGTANITSANGYELFVQKLDPDGNYLWARAAAGTGFEFGTGRDIVTDTSGNAFIAGSVNGGLGGGDEDANSPHPSFSYIAGDFFAQKTRPDRNTCVGEIFELARQHSQGNRIGRSGQCARHRRLLWFSRFRSGARTGGPLR